jgi:hypothetical protein
MENFVDEETKDRFRSDINDIFAHEDPALLPCPVIKTISDCSGRRPFGVSPVSGLVSAVHDWVGRVY